MKPETVKMIEDMDPPFHEYMGEVAGRCQYPNCAVKCGMAREVTDEILDALCPPGGRVVVDRTAKVCETCMGDGEHCRIGKRRAAADLPVQPEPCTGVTASWCPVHGDCTCPRTRPDGDFDEGMDDDHCPLHAYPHDVAAAIYRLTAERDALRALVDDFVDPGECRFDHHGHCQEHAWFETDPPCPHKRAKALGGAA